jgi:integrase
MTSSSVNPASPQLTRETFTPALIDQAVTSLPSPESRRNYRRGMETFLVYAGSKPITRGLLLKWRDHLAKTLTPGSVNVQLAAVRKLFAEAQAAGVLDDAMAYKLSRVERLRQLGNATGNWLTREQCTALLKVPNRKTLKGKRNYCVLAILLGCALRRTELAQLDIEQIQMREGRWVLADLRGKGGRLRTVAVPMWTKEAIDGWTKISGITSGLLIRRLNSDPEGLSTEAIWRIVQQSAAAIGVPNFGAHDLRRTCAKLCRAKGGRIEQIQAMLGHSSIATTERYLGTVQDLKHAVNDDLGIAA